MRAKFINEKFKENSDPVEDLDIGFAKKMKDFIDYVSTELHGFGNYKSYSCQREYWGDEEEPIDYDEMINNLSHFHDYIKEKGLEIDEIRFKIKQ